MRTLRRSSEGVPDLLETETVVPRRRRWFWWVAAGVVLVAAAVAVALRPGDSLSKVPGTIHLTGPAKTFTLDDVRARRPPVSSEALRGRAVDLQPYGSRCSPGV